jgi:His/Glu/Gln/Arg/opine family amino acid ABC transporter permease subunit
MASGRRRLLLWLGLGAAALVGLYVVLTAVEWPTWAEPVARYILTVGLPATLWVSAVAVTGSVVVGITLGTLLTIRYAPSRAVIRAYIEVFRGLPILVTVLIVYLGLPALSETLKFSPLLGTAIALTLWGSAQVAEATRGAVQSIPHEQHEAASALGFGWVGTHGFVILPQALRRLLPPLVGLLVNIIQNSTLAQAIGGIELLQASKSQVERLTFFPPAGIGEIHAVEIFGGVMILFFLISFPLTRLAAYLEKRLV